MLSDVNEVVLFFVACAAFLAVIEIGFLLGRRQRDQSDDTKATHLGALQAGLMGLFALLLGFNFAMAASRFEAREALIQEEVNAIGTAYVRAQLLPSPRRQKFTELLRAYVAARIEFTRAGADKALLEAAHADASRIGAQLWTLTSTMAAQDPSGTGTELFIQSLNDVIDLNEKRSAAPRSITMYRSS